MAAHESPRTTKLYDRGMMSSAWTRSRRWYFSLVEPAPPHLSASLPRWTLPQNARIFGEQARSTDVATPPPKICCGAMTIAGVQYRNNNCDRYR